MRPVADERMGDFGPALEAPERQTLLCQGEGLRCLCEMQVRRGEPGGTAVVDSGP